MTYIEFISAFAKENGIPKGQAKVICQSLFESINKHIEEDGKVVIFGFGSFEKIIRKARTARHPKTGEMIQVPPKEIIKFTRMSRRQPKDELGEDEIGENGNEALL